MKVKLPIMIIGATLILTGCAGSGSSQYLSNTHAALMSQGKPPAYVDGYMDGCGSGRSLSGDKRFKFCKDATRADRDALYARGWQDGQITCRNECLAEAQNVGVVVTSEDARRRRQEEAEMQEMWDEIKK